MRRVAAKSLLITGFGDRDRIPGVRHSDQATLIINVHDKSGLPRNYRATSDVSKLDGNKALSTGLDKLQASASGQFSAKGLAALLQRVPGGRPVVVLDLRQESHGFVGGTAVSWFGVRNAANNGKSGDQISRDESDLLAGLTGHTTITVKEVTSKSSDRAIEDSKDVQLPVDGVRNEEDLVRAAGANYVRVYAVDYMPFTNDEVDQLVAFLAEPAGRQLAPYPLRSRRRPHDLQALALFDMLENVGTVSLKNIVDRQHDLGGTAMLSVSSKTSWRKDAAIARAKLVRRFYMYAKEHPRGEGETWSSWAARQFAAAFSPRAPRSPSGRSPSG